MADLMVGNTPVAQEVMTLFDEFRVPLLRYTVSVGLSVSDGEDVVQEVFLALFHHLREGRPRTNLRAWVFRVGHNLALKKRQRNGRHTEVGQEWRDPRPNPEQLAAWNRSRERLQAVVRAMPERDRWCLYLRAEGLRYREIAAALGISLGTVAMSLGRSLARLSAVEE